MNVSDTNFNPLRKLFQKSYQDIEEKGGAKQILEKIKDTSIIMKVSSEIGLGMVPKTKLKQYMKRTACDIFYFPVVSAPPTLNTMMTTYVIPPTYYYS